MGGQDGHAAPARRSRKPTARMQPTETPRSSTRAYLNRRGGGGALLDGHFLQEPQAKRPKQALEQCSPKAKAAAAAAQPAAKPKRSSNALLRLLQAPRGGAGMMLNFWGLTPTGSTPTGSASGRAKPARGRESSEPGPPGGVSKLANSGREVPKQLCRAAQLRSTGKDREADKLAEAALSMETPGAGEFFFVVPGLCFLTTGCTFCAGCAFCTGCTF